MEIPLLKDIVVIFTLSILVLLLCHRLKIPSIVGFLITGVLSGPHGLGLVGEAENVKTLSEIGIVFLLFTVGMEFSLKRLAALKKYFFLGGMAQVFLTVIGGIAIGFVMGRPWGEAVFLGFLISLSSTAITLRVLEHRGETDTPQGNLIVGVLIFQDIISIPMMLIAPMLVGNQHVFEFSVIGALLKGLFLLAILFLTAEYLVPKILYFIARTRNRELFLLGILTIGFSVGYFTASLGLSLALGAFLAGLVISESEYTTEAVHDVLPFQEVFLSLFFISTGMLLDLNFLFQNILLVICSTFCVLILKIATGAISALFLRVPLRPAIITGLALSQIGEFSFVLTKTGIELGIATPFYYQLFLAVALLSMGLSPFLMEFSSKVVDFFVKLPWPESIKFGRHKHSIKDSSKQDNHVIIIGFGWCGRQIAALAERAKISTLIIEMNPDTVKKEKKAGHSIHFGDASHEFVLKHAHIEHAKVAVIVINDPSSVIRIARVIKALRPELPVVARVRYLSQMNYLREIGVEEIVCDELVSSKELLLRTLKHFQTTSEESLEILTKLEGDISSHNFFLRSILI